MLLDSRFGIFFYWQPIRHPLSACRHFYGPPGGPGKFSSSTSWTEGFWVQLGVSSSLLNQTQSRTGTVAHVPRHFARPTPYSQPRLQVGSCGQPIADANYGRGAGARKHAPSGRQLDPEALVPVSQVEH